MLVILQFKKRIKKINIIHSWKTLKQFYLIKKYYSKDYLNKIELSLCIQLFFWTNKLRENKKKITILLQSKILNFIYKYNNKVIKVKVNGKIQLKLNLKNC